MHRADHPTAIDGLYTDGNPATGLPATVVQAVHVNALQEEICNTVEGAALALDKEDNTQLLQAILSLSAVPTASQTQQGKIELATNAETQAGVDALRAITAAALASCLSYSSGNPAYIRILPWKLIIQGGVTAELPSNDPAVITYPRPLAHMPIPPLVGTFAHEPTSANAPVMHLTSYNLTTLTLTPEDNSSAAWWVVIGIED